MDNKDANYKFQIVELMMESTVILKKSGELTKEIEILTDNFKLS